MKKLLTVAIILASTSAYATRARWQALGNSPHINDAATVYSNPADIFMLNDSVTIESGRTNSVLGNDGEDGAEALVIRSMGDAKIALSLGHDDSRTSMQRNAASGTLTTIVGQQNPLELTYGMKMGDLAWAGTLVYSNFNNKKTEVEETTTALKFGVNGSNFDAAVNIGLVDKWTSGTATARSEFEGKSNVSALGGYWIASDLYAYGEISTGGYEVTSATTGTVVNEVETTTVEIGLINTMKNDGNEFFYGIGLANSETKDSKASDLKETSLYLPVVIGLEADAASWLTLRGSIAQTVLIQNDKTETNAGTQEELTPGPNSTTFSAGAGLKFGQLMLDGSILANGSQVVNGDTLLSTVGLTYNF